MCLSYVDEKPTNHKVGYKIYKNGYTYFTNTYQMNSTQYKLGQTYIAEQVRQNPLKEYNVDGRIYKAGFHYYRYLKDALKLKRSGEVVIKVAVSQILATGLNDCVPAGVCNVITLKKIMKSADNIDKELATKKLLKKGILSKILKFSKQYIKSENENIFIKVKELIISNDENFSQFIAFLDKFSRRDVIFKTITKMHMDFLRQGDSDYLKMYYRCVHKEINFDNPIVKSIDEFHKNYGEFDVNFMTENIQNPKT